MPIHCSLPLRPVSDTDFESIDALVMAASYAAHNRLGRKGTLWEERFKSVVVEGAGQALGAMAAFIDLNPVRAGMVQDPKNTVERLSGGDGRTTSGRVAGLTEEQFQVALQ